jgi:hypothetical protein
MVVLLAILGFLAFWSIYKVLYRKPNVQKSQPLRGLILDETQPVTEVVQLKVPVLVKRKRNDSDLKRVSISTNNILFTKQFEFNKSMADLLPTLSKKYRIFLITQVDNEGGP